VILFHDPRTDLEERARQWGYQLQEVDLSALAVFAAGLASAEAEGWELDKPDIATRAYESRRFLLADRIIHWAVAWLNGIDRSYPEYRELARSDRTFLLGLADEARVAPKLSGKEGLLVSGEDSLGPTEPIEPLIRWLGSLWSGDLLAGATWRSRTVPDPTSLVPHYEGAAGYWSTLADAHPGSAQLWLDLSARARRTSKMVARA